MKASPLTSEETEILKQHTTIGAVILDQVVCDSPGGEFLPMARTVAQWHHERFDGTGYPGGLAGDKIPLPARIVAVADAFDQLTSAHCFATAPTPAIVKALIEKEAGKHFDPVLVDVFRACVDELLAVREKLSDGLPVVSGAVSFLE